MLLGFRWLAARMAAPSSAGWGLLLVLIWLAPPSWAAQPRKSPKATSSREAREDAVRSISQAHLSDEARDKVTNLLAATTLFRRLPAQVIDCDPALYLFLVDHPDVVVSIWKALGISEAVMSRVGSDTYQANDGAGTRGQFEFLHRSFDTHVLYGEGSYDGSLLPKPVRGKCLLILKTAYVRETNGRYHVTCRLDAFLKVENVGIEVLAKTFQPLVTSATDHNFKETIGFVASLNRAAEMNHAGMQRLAGRLQDVPEEDRQRFSEIAEQLAVRAALAQTTAPAPRGAARRAPSKR